MPCLAPDAGRTLHEGAAIVHHIAGLVPQKQLAPANGRWERYKLQEWLNIIGTELHKGFSPPVHVRHARGGQGNRQGATDVTHEMG